MDDGGPLFILAGNGPYANRGCEAIVRGTATILRKFFRDPRFVCLSHFPDAQHYRRQCREETDGAITHLHSYRLKYREVLRNFTKPFYLGYAFDRLLRPRVLKYRVYAQMLPYLDTAAAVLSVGGDNYSLDYGVPTLFTDLDEVVMRKEKPLFLWGASVGPFSAIPDYERYMSDHLRRVTGIFARESVTAGYLASIGVAGNVHPVADPAFLMAPIRPKGVEDDLSIDGEAIGLNLSPLMAKYVTGGDLEAWTGLAASILGTTARTTGMPVYLIPHATVPAADDHAFMRRALSLVRYGDITLVPPVYNAAETKWIISRMTVFAGARTHATIAALSSGVPTLSFAYSIKAQGINRDIFGHTEYCMEPGELGAGAVSGRIVPMLDEAAAIRRDLAERILPVQEAAQSAGKRLWEVVG